MENGKIKIAEQSSEIEKLIEKIADQISAGAHPGIRKSKYDSNF